MTERNSKGSRPKQDLWAEIVRTAELVKSYDASVWRIAIEKYGKGEGLSQGDAEFLLGLASDADILAGLITDLQRQGVAFDDNQ